MRTLISIFMCSLAIICKAQIDYDTLNINHKLDTILTDTVAMSFASTLNDMSAYNSVNLNIPDYAYKSPEADAFMKYGEYNMGEYTGNAQIAIPLYEINYQDIKIPINLSYQGGGIKVADESTWVGLGWSLPIVGCINRIPNNHPDILQRCSTSISEEDYISGINNSSNYHYTTNLSYAVNNRLVQDFNNGLTEKDIYSLSFNGKQVLFFIDPNTQTATIFGNNADIYKIEKYSNSWWITDSNGYLYIFSNRERAYSSVGEYDTAWYPTSITSPLGNSISFTYSSDCLINMIPRMGQIYEMCNNTTCIVHHGYNPPPTFPTSVIQNIWSDTDIYVYKSYNSAIITNLDSIVFRSSSRDDLSGSMKLDEIIVYSRISGEIIKHWHFNYSYFVSTIQGNTYSVINDYKKKRLKLLSVTEESDSNLETYSFEYNEQYGMPSKVSYSTDIWGYYNGALTNSSFIPSTSLCFEGSLLATSFNEKTRRYKGANRCASAKYSSQYSLNKIIYPTKGYTTFEYEPHSFVSTPAYPDAQSDYAVEKNYFLEDANRTNAISTTPTRQFSVAGKSRGTLTAVFSGYSLLQMKSNGASVRLQQINVPSPVSYNLSLSNVDNGDLTQTNQYKIVEDVEIVEGEYLLVANLPDNFGSNDNYIVQCSLDIKQIVEHPESFNSIGGGIRLKTLKNYDYDGTLQNSTSYKYVLDDGKSSGKLLLPSSLGEYALLYGVGAEDQYSASMPNYIPHEVGCSEFEVLRLHSSPFGVTPINSVTGCGFVGYSRVITKKQGKQTISTFVNEPASADVHTESLQKYMSRNRYYNHNLSNGNLLSNTTLNEYGDTLSHTENTYRTLSQNHFKNNVNLENVIIVKSTYGGLSAGDLGDHFGVPQYIVSIYSFPCMWDALSKQVNISYSNGARTNVQTISYEYDLMHANNHAVIAKTENSSLTGTSYTSRYYYPTMLNDGISSAMVNEHILNALVREERYENSNLIYKKCTDFIRNQGYYVAGKIKESLTGNVWSDSLTFKYDIRNNPREIIKNECEKVCYLWSYNFSYPVAKIEGVDFSELQDFVPSDIITRIRRTSNETEIANYLTQIRRFLANTTCLITTYTYKPSVGIKTITLPNGATTTYRYDSRNRLSEKIDTNGNVIEKYSYHFKQF